MTNFEKWLSGLSDTEVSNLSNEVSKICSNCPITTPGKCPNCVLGAIIQKCNDKLTK